jgi:hypothetical protein
MATVSLRAHSSGGGSPDSQIGWPLHRQIRFWNTVHLQHLGHPLQEAELSIPHTTTYHPQRSGLVETGDGALPAIRRPQSQAGVRHLDLPPCLASKDDHNISSAELVHGTPLMFLLGKFLCPPPNSWTTCSPLLPPSQPGCTPLSLPVFHNSCCRLAGSLSADAAVPWSICNAKREDVPCPSWGQDGQGTRVWTG